MLQHITNLPNLFTSASIFCGFYALVLAAESTVGDGEPLYKAALAIIFAGIFDALDGRVARMTKTSSDFGIQYDSLADVISFGVAPAFLLYKWGLAYYGGAGLAVAFIYLTAGAMRLARFNVTTKTMSNRWSQGLTITESGGMVATIVVVHHRSGGEQLHDPLTVLIMVLTLAYLMVSNIRFRTFKELKISQRSLIGIALAFMCIAYVLMTYHDFAMVLVCMGALHIASGLLEEVIFFKQRRMEEHQELVTGGGMGPQVSVGRYHDPSSDDEDDV